MYHAHSGEVQLPGLLARGRCSVMSAVGLALTYLDATPPTGLLDERLGSSAGTPLYQLYLVAKSNLAAFNNEAVERKLAAEPLVDTSRNLLVLNLGVGIV